MDKVTMRRVKMMTMCLLMSEINKSGRILSRWIQQTTKNMENCYAVYMLSLTQLQNIKTAWLPR